ncbi:MULTISPECIES: hypothetical protein [Vibrio]|uniref:hypothetical protein n=1 Tax=Vibrio TaxID=662 RepID=UPI0011234D41|nr:MULTISPECIES: hypothetical protein [Vibrio]MBH9742169.1 hypothetical protein [Vibrio navarrensis]MDG3394397.1 hypothetical protein [Vibrio parahaemolyticus]TOA02987.1 hypothetical protein CGK35_15415 [Vibrio parahaemolyticus]HCG5552381.1 hypothetical protein [Vibrio parahaemolyticus]
MFKSTFNRFFLKSKRTIQTVKDYFIAIKNGDKEMLENGTEVVTEDAPREQVLKEIYGEATEDGEPINYK